MEFAGINKRWPKLIFDIKAVLGSLWISYSFAGAPNPPSGNMNLIVDNAVGLIGRYQRNGRPRGAPGDEDALVRPV